jgi:hypothetical protein
VDEGDAIQAMQATWDAIHVTNIQVALGTRSIPHTIQSTDDPVFAIVSHSFHYLNTYVLLSPFSRPSNTSTSGVQHLPHQLSLFLTHSSRVVGVSTPMKPM